MGKAEMFRTSSGLKRWVLLASLILLLPAGCRKKTPAVAPPTPPSPTTTAPQPVEPVPPSPTPPDPLPLRNPDCEAVDALLSQDAFEEAIDTFESSSCDPFGDSTGTALVLGLAQAYIETADDGSAYSGLRELLEGWEKSDLDSRDAALLQLTLTLLDRLEEQNLDAREKDRTILRLRVELDKLKEIILGQKPSKQPDR